MESLHEAIGEYRKQLEIGVIKKAYRGLMEYLASLRTYFANKYPGYFVSGGLYFGYMDMSYFSFSPETLKKRNLKIAIVFVHDTCRFEAWLAGYNKAVQAKTWELLKESGWAKYRLVPDLKGADSILEHVLVETPDFRDLGALTGQIERETLTFIADVEDFFANHPQQV